MQLGVDQVYLAQVGLIGVARGARAMLHTLAEVRVTDDALTGNHLDAGLRSLQGPVLGARAHGRDQARVGS